MVCSMTRALEQTDLLKTQDSSDSGFTLGLPESLGSFSWTSLSFPPSLGKDLPYSLKAISTSLPIFSHGNLSEQNPACLMASWVCLSVGLLNCSLTTLSHFPFLPITCKTQLVTPLVVVACLVKELWVEVACVTPRLECILADKYPSCSLLCHSLWLLSTQWLMYWRESPKWGGCGEEIPAWNKLLLF